MRTWMPLLLLAMVACGGNDDTDEGGNGDGDGDDYAGCEATDGQSPSVVDSSIDCTFPTENTPDRFLQVQVVVTDPQGDFTLSPFTGNVFRIYQGSGSEPIVNDAFACDGDNAGNCSASLNATQQGIDCTNLSQYRITAVIADDDGNLSPECALPTPEGTGGGDTDG
jgi:hypothetical protein